MRLCLLGVDESPHMGDVDNINLYYPGFQKIVWFATY